MTPNTELEQRALRLRAAFLRAESRNDRGQADRHYQNLWALFGPKLEANSSLHKYVGAKWAADDLRQALRLGLLQAAREYDPARGIRFLDCALFMGRKALLEYIGEFNATIHQTTHVLRCRKILAEYTEALALALSRDPTDAEVLAAALVPSDAQMLRFALANPQSVVQNDLSMDDWLEIGSGEACFAAALGDREAVDAAWESWLTALTPHQAECLVQRYGLDRTNAEAGEALGKNAKAADNGATFAKSKLRAMAEEMLAEQGLSIATATRDDLLALRFPGRGAV